MISAGDCFVANIFTLRYSAFLAFLKAVWGQAGIFQFNHDDRSNRQFAG
jgi:hypothetical protein